MRILYLSCHEPLAYDEASLFAELGHEVFIVGDRPGILRPSIDRQTNARCGFLSDEQKKSAEGLLRDGRPLEKWLVDFFDCVYLVSRNDWAIDFWDTIKSKRVLFRLIGQSDDGTQIRLKPMVRQGMVVVGYSPHENKRFNEFKISSTIRFYKDPEEWKGWRGETPSVMTSCQSIQRDGECCNPTLYREVTRDLPAVLYGPGNEDFLSGRTGRSTGVVSAVQSKPLSYETLKEKYRSHRAYFYVGTRPASYTLNFIESWMTGIPLVSVGPSFNANEVAEIISPRIDGFYSDSACELRDFLSDLLTDLKAAAQIGEKGRAAAIKIFGKQTIKSEWDNLFRKIA